MPFSVRMCRFSVKTGSNFKLIANRIILTKSPSVQCCFQSNLKGNSTESKAIKPVPIKRKVVDTSVPEDLVGRLQKNDVRKVMVDFFGRKEILAILEEEDIEKEIYPIAKTSFIKFCSDLQMQPELYVVLSDIINGFKNVLDLIPYFIKHIHQLYPHLKFKEELKKAGDLTNPKYWYPLARAKRRKIIIHHGPTNSGKTYNALMRYLNSKTGIYCAPLKLLAHEVYKKSNEKGVHCDFITGEEKKYVISPDEPADHISCTVEMAPLEREFEVAVIDEIQMLQDINRGFAWTRALLGLNADEIHVCGEETAVNYVIATAKALNDDVESIGYKRLTKLYLEEKAVQTFRNVQDGDCIICFNKKDILTVVMGLKKLNIENAVIYGALPPATKLAQAKQFNERLNNCRVLVATDAVGLGLNLNIRRVVFYSVHKRKQDRIEELSASQALQIAGRAGRFNSSYDKGYVAAFKSADIATLKDLLNQKLDPVTQAGLFPSPEQIEMFSYYLPQLKLSELIDVFTSLSEVDHSQFFVCDMALFKRNAKMIEHLPLPVSVLYIFCTAPVAKALLCENFLIQVAKEFSCNRPITSRFVEKFLSFVKYKAKNLSDISYLENAFDCLELYLWLGNHFPAHFPDSDAARALQEKIDNTILENLSILKSVQGSLPPEDDDLKDDVTDMEVRINENRTRTEVLSLRKQLYEMQNLIKNEQRKNKI